LTPETLHTQTQVPIDPADFYQAHLDRVSRSFAFCIARLDGALRAHVGLSYLLCRIVDTIEDADWIEFKDQESAFERFDQFLISSPRPLDLAIWRGSFPTGLPEGEVLLLADAARLFSDFHALADEVRIPLSDSIISMSAGMRHFMARKSRAGKLVLSSGAEVNRYCFFVAGVVGEMLTRFVAREAGSKICLKDAFRFGLFLQKVNLLKDQRRDEKLGRCLVPSRKRVFSSLLLDAEAALRYVTSLPEKEVGFRVFCGWSLFVGLASLPWIQRSYSENSGLKIPREETLLLLGAIEETIGDNSGLEKLFKRLRPAAELFDAPEDRSSSELQAASDRALEQIDEVGEEGILLSLYRGDLPKEQVLELFRGVQFS
jgi:phytoene/squalene synthetase